MALKCDVDWTPPTGNTKQYLLIWLNGTGTPVNSGDLGSAISHFEFSPAGGAMFYQVDRYAHYGEESMHMATEYIYIIKGDVGNLKLTLSCT